LPETRSSFLPRRQPVIPQAGRVRQYFARECAMPAICRILLWRTYSPRTVDNDITIGTIILWTCLLFYFDNAPLPLPLLSGAKRCCGACVTDRVHLPRVRASADYIIINACVRAYLYGCTHFISQHRLQRTRVRADFSRYPFPWGSNW